MERKQNLHTLRISNPFIRKPQEDMAEEVVFRLIIQALFIYVSKTPRRYGRRSIIQANNSGRVIYTRRVARQYGICWLKKELYIPLVHGTYTSYFFYKKKFVCH